MNIWAVVRGDFVRTLCGQEDTTDFSHKLTPAPSQDKAIKSHTTHYTTWLFSASSGGHPSVRDDAVSG